jgi:hypothetical protein
MKAFLVSRLGFGSGSSSTSGQESSTNNTNTTEDIQMDYGMVTGSISSIPQVKKLVVQTAINKLFTDNHFSICTLDKVMDVMNISENTDAYKQLRALHCVHYSDMTKEMRDVLPLLVNEALKVDTINIAATQALKDIEF